MNLKAHRFGAILTERKQTHSVVLMSLACDICETESHLVVSDSLRPHVLYSPWNSLGQNTGVGILSLLQGIFPTQGSKQALLHCRWILYQLSYQGSSAI